MRHFVKKRFGKEFEREAAGAVAGVRDFIAGMRTYVQQQHGAAFREVLRPSVGGVPAPDADSPSYNGWAEASWAAEAAVAAQITRGLEEAISLPLWRRLEACTRKANGGQVDAKERKFKARVREARALSQLEMHVHADFVSSQHAENTGGGWGGGQGSRLFVFTCKKNQNSCQCVS